MRADPKRYWVERLCAGSLLHVLWSRLRGGPVEVRYLARTSPALALLKVARFLHLPAVACQAIQGSLGTRRSPAGQSLRYDAERFLLDLQRDVSLRLGSEPRLSDRLRRRLPGGRLRVHVENALAAEIWPVVVLAHVAIWHRSQGDVTRGAREVVLGPTRLVELLVSRFGDQPLDFDSYDGSLAGDGFGALFAELVRAWGSWIKQCVRAAWLAGTGDHGSGRNGLPVVAVEYVWGVDLSQRSDLYWLPGSGIKPEQVLVYSARKDRGESPQLRRALRETGVRWVDSRRWRPPKGYLAELCRCLVASHSLLWSAFCSRVAFGRWEWVVLARLMREVTYWEAFFRFFGVRAHVSHSFGTMPRTLAAETSGAIDISSQYSHIPFMTALLRRAHHVLFVWGAYYGRFLRESRSKVECLVSVGYIFDNMIGDSQKRGSRIREKLEAAGATYVICLLDSTFSDFPNNQTRDQMVTLYRPFLEALLADETLGIVIKPKSPDLRPALPEIGALLDRCLSTGRCLLLDRRRPTGTTVHTPLDAAMAADIAVGGVHVNTAVLEAALAGLPAVHVDLTGHRSHPFYKLGYGDFLFDNADDLVQAIAGHRNGGPRLGQHADVLDGIDPFRDGRAADRAGAFLSKYLCGIESGKPPFRALDEAAAGYTKTWAQRAATPDLVTRCLPA